MDIEQSKERCKELTKEAHAGWIGLSNIKAIGNVLEELEKKDKVINEMGKRLSYVEDLKLDVCVYCKEDCRIPRNEGDWIKTDCIKEYFTKKVEGK